MAGSSRRTCYKASGERRPDGTQRNPGRHRRLLAISDYAPLHPSYAFERSCKNRILANLFRRQIDFRLRPYYLSKPLRSNVSRQQSCCFNDLQGLTSSNSATAFDNRRRIVLKTKIPLTKGRLPEASREVERVRFPRADLQSAPGRFGYQPPGMMTGMGGASLDWDRRRRVTPAQTTSQEAWPEAEPLG
jgi:hypothetical protein